MRNVALALIVAAALGAGAIYLTRGTAPGASRPTATGAVNAPDAAPVDPAPYLAAFPLTAPDVPAVTGATADDRALDEALRPMRAGDYAAAATALDGWLADHPGESRAQLYLGIARLFMDEPQNALEILRPLEYGTPPDVAAEAAWYSLVGIARLRDPSSVDVEAKALCARGLSSSARACAAVERLEGVLRGR